MKRLPFFVVALVVLGLGFLPLNAVPVLADASGPNAFTFTTTCGGVEYTVTTPSGPADVGQISESTGVSIPSLVIVTLNGQVVDTFVYGAAHGQALGVQDATTTCTSVVGPYLITTYQFMTPR